MNNKTSKLQKATTKVKDKQIVLYHIITPISKIQFDKINSSGYFNPSQHALGGQSNGYYFFTSLQGANNHIETNKDSWDTTNDKNAYLVECIVNISNIKYPNWKLDYESMQDFLFDMIYDAALSHSIKFDDIEINATDDKKLTILNNGKFTRIKSFCANDHSGLIEKIADFLYHHNKKFKQEYDNLLQETLVGKGENQNLYAIKTEKKQKISKITAIETPTNSSPNKNNSQIDKFFLRYKTRNK